MNKNEKPFWIYAVVLGVFVSPTLFILGIVIGSNASLPKDKAWEYVFIALSAVATCVIAILTIILAVETWRLRRNQDEQIDSNRKESIRPHIEIFLESSIVGFQFIIFKVENIGRGIAKNIRFEFKKPDRALLKSEKDIIDTLEQLSFFSNSLSILGVNGTKKSFLFSFIEMQEKYGQQFFDTKLSFKLIYDDIEGNSYNNISIIDLSEFKGITEIGKGNPAYRTSIELEKIRKTLDKVVDNRRLRVDSYSQKDRDKTNDLVEKRRLEYLSLIEKKKSLNNTVRALNQKSRIWHHIYKVKKPIYSPLINKPTNQL